VADEHLYFSKRKPAKCPACGSRAVVRIVYGYPNPGLLRDAEHGKVALGGCCISGFDPSWQCLECEASIHPEALRGQMPLDLRTFVEEEEWTFAKTMPEWPHEYIVRDRVDERLFERLVIHIREHGAEGPFYEKVVTYYEESGLVYWTMGAPLRKTFIVNRCRSEDTYERRQAEGSLP
jgi:hypothetical protein